MTITSTGNLAAAVGTTGSGADSSGTPPVAKLIAICDTQPVTAEGVRNLLRGVPDLRFLTAAENLAQAAEIVRQQRPSVLILDKGFGIQALLDWLAEIQASEGTRLQTGMVVWGVSVTEAEALRFCRRERAESSENPRKCRPW